jgi:thymidylate synthase ThyX
VIPEEIRSCGLEGIFTYIVKAQNSFYHELYRDLEDYVFEKHQDMASNKANRSVLEGWAKEDARYIVSMATQTQLGMTINARNLELMLRRAAAHPLKEVNEYGTKLHNAVKDIAPSLVRYIKPTLFDSRTKSILREKILELLRRSGRYATKGRAVCESGGDVNLIYATPEGDEKILASLVHSSSGLAMKECEAVICEMSADEKEEILKTACIYMESYDPPSREFENADFIFEVTVSATCFAQLKRHRMATIVCQNYDPSLGVTVPSSIVSVGMEKRFMDMIRETEDVYGIVRSKSPEAAAYVLTNAHRKRVMVKVNARELYHISRLREDSHAQWDIRNIARQMVNLGKEEMPLSLFLTGGKDEFEALS